MNKLGEFTKIAGSLQAGVLLSQIAYWFAPSSKGSKLRVKRDGKAWLAKRRVDWAEECGLTPRQYDTAIAKLVERGLVETHVWGFSGRPTVHIWLNGEGLNACICNFHITPMGFPNHTIVISNTETTTETTTEIKHERLTTQAEKQQDAMEELVRENKAEDTSQAVEPSFRKIDNWVADRPGLAQQRLKTRFTAEEWLMKASEVLKLHREKTMPAGAVRLTANSLAMAWKQLYSRRYEEFVKDFNHKEMGQMKMFLAKVGNDAPRILRFVFDDWLDFTIAARYRYGLFKSPERPTIGFLLQYYDVAVQLSAKPEPSIDKVEPEAQTPPEVIETPEKEPVATIEMVEAALASFGHKK